MTKIADSPLSSNKELPSGERARCRQKKTENTGTRRRAPDSPCPNARGAQYQRPTPKSNLEASGYPGVQNICHIALGRDGTLTQNDSRLFDITQTRVVPGRRLRQSEFVGSSSGPQAARNSLMYGSISAPPAGLSLFSLWGLPDRANSLL
jgi:hypothetical protein